MWQFPAVIVTYPDGRTERHGCLTQTEAVALAARLLVETEPEFASVRIEQNQIPNRRAE